MISHDHKLIFLHIPKCAGRSIAEVFNARPDHFTARYYEKDYAKRFEEYDVFTIVRDPYDRLLSMYNYIQQHRRHPSEPIAARENGQVPTFKEWVIRNLEAFNKVGLYDHESAEAEWGKDYQLGSPFWFSPQKRWVQNKSGKQIRVFNLEYGLTPIYGYLLQHGVTTPIPHANKSSKNGKQTSDFYDDELYELLSNTAFIKTDCEMFDYKLIQPVKQ